MTATEIRHTRTTTPTYTDNLLTQEERREDAPSTSSSHPLFAANIGGAPDFLPPPAYAPQQSRWKNYLGKGFMALGASAGVPIRLQNYNRWINALACVGTGALAVSSISWGCEGATMARIRQVSLTVLGSGSFYLLSQLYANTDPGVWHTLFADATIGLLGANIQIVLKWIWEQQGVRTESYSGTERGHSMSEIKIISDKQELAMKFSASAAALTGSLFFSNPIAKALTSFGATYLFSSMLGGLSLRYINGKIEKYEASTQQTEFSLNRQGTKWRTFKNICNTVGSIAIPLCFIPWDVKPDTKERLAQFTYIGGALGLSSGFTEESQLERFQKIPVNELEELMNLQPPDIQENHFKYCLWRTWHIGVPLFSSLGLTAFCASQLLDLKNTYSKIAISMTLTGFLVSNLGCKYIDHIWDPSSRNLWKDRFMTRIWVAPKIFGINPLYIYLAGTNAVLMDNNALEEMNTALPITVALVSWGMYGLSLGREIYITASDRIGNQLKWPLMLFANAAITTKLSIAGERGVP